LTHNLSPGNFIGILAQTGSTHDLSPGHFIGILAMLSHPNTYFKNKYLSMLRRQCKFEEITV
jgi:hypothetical protein